MLKSLMKIGDSLVRVRRFISRDRVASCDFVSTFHDYEPEEVLLYSFYDCRDGESSSSSIFIFGSNTLVLDSCTGKGDRKRLFLSSLYL